MERDKELKKAVALRYAPGQDRAPKVLAAGRGLVAERILGVAEERGLPVYEDPTLVELLSHLDLGAEIPDDLYKMVAEVLIFVYSLDKNARKKQGGF